MTLKWLAGNRIEGTSADRTTGTAAIPAVAGGWKELSRTTLGSAGDTIDVSSLSDKRYYMVLTDNIASGLINSRFRLGNSSVDTGSNYARRGSENGAADTTDTSADHLAMPYAENGNTHFFGVHYVSNKSDKEKLLVGHCIDEYASGSGNTPARFENAGKWTNTSNVIDVIRNYNSASGDYASGSEVVVLGYDPDDTHTTNFWEQLADVTTSSSADFFSSGTITAKKYLWVQAYVKQASPYSTGLQFNSDTANNYAIRFSGNGNSDSTAGTNTWKCAMNYSSLAGGGYFMNAFIINNASKEKLVLAQTTENSSSGAGTAPNRLESAGKWANTSDQITSIQIRKESGAGGGQIQSGSFIKVWGSN